MSDKGYSSPLRRGLSNGSSERIRRGPGQMQGLLGEFRGLYESRLQRLDEAEKAGEDTQKVRILLQICTLSICM